VPVSAEIIAAARRGDWQVLLTPNGAQTERRDLAWAGVGSAWRRDLIDRFFFPRPFS
jgi:hypothetical protein